MKTTRLLLAGLIALCASLLFTGCKDENAIIQNTLNQILPAGFEGDLKGNHDGFYFGVSVHLDVDMRGLKKVNGQWTWSEGGYKRSGFFSTGGVTLSPKVK